MNSEDVQKFELIMIESLPNHETKTGFNLFSSIIKYKLFQEPNLSSSFYDIDNKQDMFSLFDQLVHKALSQNHFFFLHFEIHGYEDGIEVKNGERIDWGEMIPYFRKINVHFRNLLCLYFAVCKSGNIIKYLDPEDRAPFRIIVTTMENVSVSNLVAGFEKFYEHFFFSFDAEESLEAYNSVIDDTDEKLYLITSDYCFDQIADIDRETINKKSLVEEYKASIANRAIYRYLTNEQLNKVSEILLRKDFDELKAKGWYFKMLDLRN